jgi:hypothetical protein
MSSIFKIRRDTSTNWTTHNPILAEGEMGLDQTNNFIKMGDGSTTWNSLPQFTQNIENVEDLVGAMVSGNTENGIVVTYDDATGKLNFDVGDPNLSISGDATATATMTDLGNTNLALTLADTAVTPGSYGSASLVPVITVDSKGRLTSAGTTAVAGVDSVGYNTATGVINIDTSDGSSHTIDIGVGTADSPTFTGLNTTADISFGDNDKAVFGASGNLEIYSDAASSYINETGSGHLFIKGENILLAKVNGQNYITCTGNEVKLAWGGGAKLTTTSGGVDVAGNIVVSGTVDGRDIALDESNATTDRALIRTEMATNETDRDTSEAAAISTAINALVDSAPGTLDTLNELAAAIGDDANHLTTMTSLISSNETARDTSIAAQEVLNATARTNIQDDVDANELASDNSHGAATTDRALIRTEMAGNETARDTSIAAQEVLNATARTVIQDDVDANELASDNSHTAATTDRALIRTEMAGNESARDTSIAAQEVLNATARTNIQDDVDANELASDGSHSAATTDRALIRTEMAGNETARDTSVTNSLALKVNKAGDTITGNLDLADNVKATFGNSNDLQIYHNSTDNSSYITEWGTGNLKIMGDNLYLQNSSGDNYVTGVSGGQTALYHDGSNRMYTTSIGINVLGDIALSGLVDTRNVASDGAAQDSHIADTSNPHSVTKAQVGLGNVTNESKATMFTSAALTSTPTAPTAASNTNTTQIATTAYVQTELTELIGGAVGTLDTLNELATAINNDASYASTLTTALATKLPLAGGTMTGNVSLGDDVKAQFGASNDLEIYHDSSNGQSIIKESGPSVFKLMASDIRLSNTSNTQDYISCNDGGDVKLAYAGANKLATTSTGVTVTGTATATSFVGDGSALTGIISVPSGLISMWSGASSAIPSDWKLCDGTNGTPNLVGKFIKGASTAGGTGGSATHTHTHSLSAASHTLTLAQIPSHTHSSGVKGNSLYTSSGYVATWSGAHASSGYIGTGSAGGGQSHSHILSGSIAAQNNEPPYYELCYIMKT